MLRGVLTECTQLVCNPTSLGLNYAAQQHRLPSCCTCIFCINCSHDRRSIHTLDQN
ncbi:hypothetical protein B0F90DRAFT_1759249 [Multifurca ochricompacta]|uniref:Uncharacterized protein n=1 Tax=Multifurca ochricompacta TaxID=376703 RepID=A0AAD4QGS8_9AGAM|nr:hypothetical protein B0F90DRAFT_1759249 [Multifurca ochricompacta]